MQVLERMLADPTHQPLLDVIKTFKRGTVGKGHADVPSREVVGVQDKTALSIDGTPGTHATRETNGKSSSRGGPGKEDDLHTPLTVTGPKGKERKVVKHSSFGLQFAYDAMEGSPDLWKLDVEVGVLSFNIRHPLWKRCESSDTALMKLQELVAIEALTLHFMPVHSRSHQQLLLCELNYTLVSWLLLSDQARTHSYKKVVTS